MYKLYKYIQYFALIYPWFERPFRIIQYMNVIVSGFLYRVCVCVFTILPLAAL